MNKWQTAKTTPRNYDGHQDVLIVEGKNQIAVMRCEDAEKQAARIVAAVNAHADALTLLEWAADCWKDGELRPDFDDCVDQIRAFLAARRQG